MDENETTPVQPTQPTPPTPPATQHPIPAPRARRSRLAAAGGALGALGIAAGVVIGVQTGGTATGTVAQQPTAASQPVVLGRGGYGYGFGGFGSSSGSTGGTTGGSTTTTPAGTATADQVVGVVDITTTLGYQDAQAAGTGMILTSTGEILTNNHVVEGATSITVMVLSTGQTYDATVVGTSPTADVAVLQLSGASGLDTVDVDRSGVDVGDAVTAVGNAGGDPDSTSAAAGSVTALDQSITATDDSGSDAEQLTGLVETNADVQAGDSGGPLFDADGQVVGMDTAASSGGAVQSYAIPIGTALDVVDQIESGVDDTSVHQGLPAFLGVSVQSGTTTSGAAIADVVSGGPAETAGLAAGDVITAVGGTTVTSADDLSTALAAADPGDRVQVSWTDTTGTSHTATVTLVAGPAD